MKNPTKQTESNGSKLTIQEPKRNFIMLYDSVYKNNDLTTNELALIVKLLSSAPNFKPTSRKLASILKIDIKALNKASKDLQKKGYLKIKKFGKSSEWIITQEPLINRFTKLTTDNLVNALLNFEITLKDLKQLHRLKYIDDKILIETTNKYIKEIQIIVKTNWLDTDE